MKIGFMTSVCPHQTIPDLIATAQRYGYQGIEFRVEWGHAHGIELAATPAHLRAARTLLDDAGVEPSCIATSVKFNSPNRQDHLEQREILARYIELIAVFKAPYIRTFADSLPDETQPRDAVMMLAAESYRALDDQARQAGVCILVETHTNMSGHWARQIIDLSGASSIGVLWHTGHHLQRGQSIDTAYSYIRPYVRHVHFTATAGDPYVSDADNQTMVNLLANDQYAGFLSVEIINPQDPDSVLAWHIQKYWEYRNHVSSS